MGRLIFRPITALLSTSSSDKSDHVLRLQVQICRASNDIHVRCAFAHGPVWPAVHLAAAEGPGAAGIPDSPRTEDHRLNQLSGRKAQNTLGLWFPLLSRVPLCCA